MFAPPGTRAHLYSTFKRMTSSVPGAGLGALGPKKCWWVNSDPVCRVACMVHSKKITAATPTNLESSETPGMRSANKDTDAATAANHDASSIRSETLLCSCTAALTDAPT